PTGRTGWSGPRGAIDHAPARRVRPRRFRRDQSDAASWPNTMRTRGYALAKRRSAARLSTARARSALVHARGAASWSNAHAKWLASPARSVGGSAFTRYDVWSGV